MIRKFCSVKEAAERLDATEDQIENLLRKGMLREFRDGPHRLLRTADVGAIVVARNRRLERQGQPRAPRPARPSSSGRDHPSPAHPAPSGVTRPAIRLPRSATGAPASARRAAARPRTMTENHQEILGPGRTTCKSQPVRATGRASSPARPRGGNRSADPEIRTPYQTLSLREWFWSGLIQDNPLTVILLCTSVLLVVSALVAGVFMLKDVL